VEARLKQDNPDISKAIVDMVIWADRVKCWLYQADSDLLNLAEEIEFVVPEQKQDGNSGTGSETLNQVQTQSVSQAETQVQPPSQQPQSQSHSNSSEKKSNDLDDAQNILPSRIARLARRQQQGE
jgi:hypothetical protein